MEEIKKFKFSANLEFVSEALQQRKIKHYTDFDTNILLAENSERNEILKIISRLEIDENDVEKDEDAIEGFKEWNQNMYNPGHFTGGKTPHFQKDKNNYIFLGMMILVGGLTALLEITNTSYFSKNVFWIGVIITLYFSGSMFYQHYKLKKKKK